MPYSTLPRELLAFGEGASCVRRTETDRVASRPHRGLPQDHEKGWVGGFPILVPRFRGNWSSHPGENLKKDRPSAPRFVIIPRTRPSSRLLGSSRTCRIRLRASHDARGHYSGSLAAVPNSIREASAATRPPRNFLAICRSRNDPRAFATSVHTNIKYFSIPVTHSAQITYHTNTHPPSP